MESTGKFTNQKVAIIGGGPSGTAMLRAFKSAADKGTPIPQVVCFEKQAEIGGLWNYTWRTGLDEHGNPCHGSMYRYLWSNAPKECLEFGDYSFEEHFGKTIPSFPPREVLCDYIKGRIKKANVMDWVRLETVVRHVEFSEETKMFTLISRNVKTHAEKTEEFDWVVCANGHFSVPNVPEWPGFDHFEGRILHSHDFRDAMEFKGKDILMIGTSYSAEDIVSQCYKYGVGSVTCSYRTNPMPWKWPENFTTVPLLEKVEGNICTFKDGSSKKIDAIILCTGYQHAFPFLPDTLRLQTSNRLWPDQLYNGIFLERNPKMIYIGMQNQFYTFLMFDAQAWYARDQILGKIELPDAKTQAEHFKKWRAEEGTLKTAEDMIAYQGRYVTSLIADTDYPAVDIEGTIKEFYQWKANKRVDIMNFRDCQHTSVITGHTSSVHHTTWLKAMDDSMECYLKDKAE